jgi:hypothetical protein
MTMLSGLGTLFLITLVACVVWLGYLTWATRDDA